MVSLREAARLGVELQHAVIAFADLESRLSARDRDFLWQAFGVPVFEQCLGTWNELAAAECEAHEGVHVWRAVPAEWDGYVEHARCACGNAAPRLIERKKEVARAV
jgi:hypothetical protein